MKALTDILLVAASLWMTLVKFLPLFMGTPEPDGTMNGEPAMVITETVSAEQAKQQEELQASLDALTRANAHKAAQLAELEKKHADDEQQRQASALQKSDAEKQADQRRAVQDKQFEEQRKATADAERKKLDAEKQAAAKQLAEAEEKIKAAEKLRADVERERAEIEKQKADAAKREDEKKATTPEKPMEPPQPPPKVGTQEKELRHWGTDLNAAIEESKRTGVPVFIDFQGESCLPCVEVARVIYGSKKVSPLLRGDFIPVWLYCTDKNDNHRSEFMNEREKQAGVVTFPLAVLLNANGTYRRFVPRVDPKRTAAENIQAFLDQLYASK